MLDKPSLTLKRRIAAPPATVFRAWTDPQKIAGWFGPDLDAVVSATADPRVGGRYRIIFKGADGEEHNVGGVYREVEENRKLVFTWGWITMPERKSLVTVTLKEDGGGTLLTLLHEKFFDEPARDRHEAGWAKALEKLDRYCTREKQEV